MPFLEYTVQVVHGITMGTRLWVRPRYVSRRSINAHDPSSELPLPEARPAEVKRIPRYLRYDLVYLDNGEEESEVSHQRVDVSRSFQDAATQRLIYRMKENPPPASRDLSLSLSLASSNSGRFHERGWLGPLHTTNTETSPKDGKNRATFGGGKWRSPRAMRSQVRCMSGKTWS